MNKISEMILENAYLMGEISFNWQKIQMAVTIADFMDTIEEKSAMLYRNLLMSKPFAQQNAEIAFQSMVQFLNDSNIILSSNSIEEGVIELESITAWIKDHTKKG